MRYDELTLSEDSVFLNSKLIHDDDFDQSIDWLSEQFIHYESCPFCKTILFHMLHDYETESKTEFEERFGDEKFSSLKVCKYCNYWQWYFQDPYSLNSWGCPDHYVHAGISKIRDFNEQLPDGCYSELAEGFRRNPELWHTINPTVFEKFVAAVFKANYRDCEVMHVGRPDGGVDVVFIDSGRVQWLVQVKRRESPNSTEGIGTLRSLLGTMTLEGASCGIVVSTADHFSYRAKEAIGKANDVGKILRLMDRGKLNRMLEPLIENNPWNSFIRGCYDSNLATIFEEQWNQKK